MLKKYYIVLSLGLLSLLPQLTQADAIAPDEKNIEYCLTINDINDYSNYTIVVWSSGALSEKKIVQNGDCVSFYKFNNAPRFFAIQDTAFDITILNTSDDEFEALIKNNPTFIEAQYNYLPQQTLVNITNPIKKITDVLAIRSLTDTTFILEYDMIDYVYTDDSFTSLSYTDQTTRPTAPYNIKASVQAVWFPWLIAGLSTFGLIIILILLLVKRKQCRVPSA